MSSLRPADRERDRLSARAATDSPLALSSGQRILRVVGAIILTICALMAILGATIWTDALHGPLFAVYWSWCFLLAILTVFIALWDMLLVRRAFQRRRRELFRAEFMTDEFVANVRGAIERDEDSDERR